MRPIVRLLIVILLLCAGASDASASARTAPKVEITQFKLKNGLRVIHAPMRRVPAVTVQLWYHAGSKDERRGIRGVAHMFEHMMFKGSKRVKPEAHARMLGAIGGMINAYTTADVTVYFNTVPTQYMGFAMELEAERMRNLTLTDATIKSEREVVKEEKRMRLDNNPIGRAVEAIWDMAYTKHPYAWTPAGDMADLDAITMAQCQAFYERYYTVQNATLVVVGDVSAAQVKAVAEEKFGSLPRGAAPPRVEVREPPQTALRRKVADWPSQLNVVLGAYHVPGTRHADIPALEVLSAILSRGRSARLNQALVRKGKLSLYAGGFLRDQEHPGLMMIYAVGLPAHDLARMEQALLQEVEKVATDGVTEDELRKAKSQLSTGLLAALRTPAGVARQLGMSALMRGDPAHFLGDVQRLDAVTGADVKRVAATYLKRDNLSLLLLGKQRTAAAKPAPAAAAKKKEEVRK